jgi:Spy/CpxP family protein refolding chaperone
MHPATLYWWKYGRRRGECGAWVGYGLPAEPEHCHVRYASAHRAEEAGGGFGVRRPLRFLAYKLQLNETQVAEFARILEELKIERAQAEVDSRRTVSAVADALLNDAFDEARAAEGVELRVKSAERLRDAVLKALRRMHAQLDAEQRETLAYLIRTGALMI